MSSNFTLSFTGDCIEVAVAPDYEITRDSQRLLWGAVAQACKQHRCIKVLSIGKAPKRRMSTVDAFNSVCQAAQIAPGIMLAIYFRGYIPDETTALFKNTAYNRGARVEFFSDIDAARAWLAGDATSAPG